MQIPGPHPRARFCDEESVFVTNTLEGFRRRVCQISFEKHCFRSTLLKTEAQRGAVTAARSHSKSPAVLGSQGPKLVSTRGLRSKPQVVVADTSGVLENFHPFL